MKILLASSEVYPYSKSGGLADMVGALAKFLARAGDQVGLVTPLYRGIRDRFAGVEPFDWKLDLPMGGPRVQAKVRVCRQADGTTIYFIDHPAYYERADMYGERGTDYRGQRGTFYFLFQMRGRTWRAICPGSRRCCICTIGRRRRPRRLWPTKDGAADGRARRRSA